MTRIKILGLALVALFAMSAVVSASASALQWLLNGKPITTALPISSEGSLLLADLSQRTAIVCEGTGKGTVGPAAKDQVNSVVASACRFQTGLNGPCEASGTVTAKALNTPWLTLLLTVSNQTRDFIYPNTSGKNPGWNVECKVAGILTVSDECTTGAGKPLTLNLAKGVATDFEESEVASCNKGTATSGMVLGGPLNLSPANGTLSVSNSPNI